MNESKAIAKYDEKPDWFIGYDNDFEPVAVDDKTGIEYYQHKAEPARLDHDVLLTKRLSALLREYEQKNASNGWERIFESRDRKHQTAESIACEASVSAEANESGIAPSVLSIKTADLGAIVLLFFGGLLVLSAVSGTPLVAPLVGWIGTVFGIGFMVMGRVSTRQLNP